MSAANAALAGLYQAHATELKGFARRRVGREEAEDVVQDAYLHLLQRGTAANLAVDFARKAKIRLRYVARLSISRPMRWLRPIQKPQRAPQWSWLGCTPRSQNCRRSAATPFCSIELRD
jgi:DNA-directed RNA polymerase specialized sigma24 family protein